MFHHQMRCGSLLLASSAFALGDHPALQNADLLITEGNSRCKLREVQAGRVLWLVQGFC